jgi:hypothetical protein
LCKRRGGSTTYAFYYDYRNNGNIAHTLILKRVVANCGKDILLYNLFIECLTLLEAFSGKNHDIERGLEDDKHIKDELNEEVDSADSDPDDKIPF